MTKKYYGSQTALAINNFPFDFRKTHREFLHAIIEIKKAAAMGHAAVHELDSEREKAIVAACDELLEGKYDDQFPLPSFQGGAGTSNHMNVNEVIAHRATEMLEEKKKTVRVHQNDHVNMSHSTNDVMPSAAKIAAFRLALEVDKSCDVLVRAFEKKAKEFAGVQKLGRTHMQDAVPTTFGAECGSYAATIKRRQEGLKRARTVLLELNLGGSAIGNSINNSPKYLKALYVALPKVTKLPLKPAKNFMSQTGSVTDFLVVSQALTALAADLSKIAGDFRILASGPKGGFGEVILPELQAGSSIMPGKVNPVLPEALSQLYYLVSGNNVTIEHACAGGQLELDVMMPVITDRIVESLKLSAEMIKQFADKCVAIMQPDRKKMKEHLENSTAYSTLLNPRLGYDAVSACVKEAIKSGKTLREVVIAREILTEKEFDQMTKF